jgi:hypothetical protein
VNAPVWTEVISARLTLCVVKWRTATFANAI